MTTTVPSIDAMKIINKSVTNNDTFVCESAFDGKIYVGESLIYVFAVLLIAIAVLNIILNSAVVYALHATEQLENPSLQLIMFLCISDCCSAVFTQPLYVYMLLTFKYYSCDIDSAVEFLSKLFAKISAYIVGLIGYDRCFRLKYLNSYPLMVRSWKVYVSVLIAILVGIVVCTIELVGTH